MTDPREISIELPTLKLAAQCWGAPTAPPLVALHGWLDNAGSFARLAPLLAAQFQVIALELPGHGHSGHLGVGAHYHLADYLGTLLAALDALKLPRCTVLGHSLGAGVATLLAAAAPARVDHLCLIEGLGPLADDGTDTLQRLRNALSPPAPARPLRAFASIEQAIHARTMASGLREELARPIVERGLRQGDDGCWRWRSDPRLARPSALRMAETQVRALLRGIAAPTSLLLARPATSYLPDAMMRERAACVADANLAWLDGGHHLHLEHPQQVVAWVTASVARNR